MNCPYCNNEMVVGYIPYKGFGAYWISNHRQSKMMVKIGEKYVPIANKKIIKDVYLCKTCNVIVKRLETNK